MSVAPSAREFDGLAAGYMLDRDNLEDAVDVYEAPRIEIEDDVVYICTQYCHPEGKEIATELLLVIYTANYLVAIVRAETSTLDRLTGDELEFVTTQKTKLLLHILSEINHSYERQINKASKQILRIRGQMRSSRLSTREFLSII